MNLQEQDDYIEETQEDNYDIEIYSNRAIWGFSLFFSTIFGGVLLMLNLREAGFKKEANIVLAFSIVYTFVGSYILSLFGLQTGYVALIFNGIGAAILTEYFFKKYFPEDDYYPKSIVKPLIVSLLICVVLVLFVYNFAPKELLPAK